MDPPRSKQQQQLEAVSLVPPKKTENAWKSKREALFDGTIAKLTNDERKHEKIVKDMRGLLNKITPTTFEQLSAEFVKNAMQADQSIRKDIFDLIFAKAVEEEPHFCSLYADLCRKQAEVEQNLKRQHPAPSDASAKSESPLTTFRQGLIQKCVQTFAPSTNDKKIAELEAKIGGTETTDEKAKTRMRGEIETLKTKEKRRLLGFIRFIAQLYRRKLLIDSVITWCVVELIKKYQGTKDEIYIEYAVQMIETVGDMYESSLKKSAEQKQTQQQPQAWGDKKQKAQTQPDFDQIFQHLTQLKQLKISNHLKFMLMGLEELRRNGWKKLRGVLPEILPVARPSGLTLASGEHPLHYSWSFWYLKGDRQKDWVDCLRKIADFDTVERFFELYNYIQPASTLSWGSDYYLFKTGIQPMWEDPHNIDGGRWVANIEKNKRQTKLDDCWLELLMAVIGEQFGDVGGPLVCGAAMNSRVKGNKLALWTGSAADEHDGANQQIGTVMAEKLGATELVYIVHKDSSIKRGSGIRPKLSIAA